MLPALPRVLVLGIVCLLVPILTILVLGLSVSAGRAPYDLLRDLFVPMIGPMVAVFVPLLLFFIIPNGENRQKTALDLCRQYFAEEMRDARNTGWRYFVIDLKRSPVADRTKRYEAFFQYLMSPESHGEMEPGLDIVFQKACRVLDFFALVNECVARGSADRTIVRSFLIYYYLWWRDEIMTPLRQLRPIRTNDPKVKPGWWNVLKHLDQLSKSSD